MQDDSLPRLERQFYVRTVLAGVVPAVVLALLYAILFAERRDYLGHYAAGFGGSLGAMVLVFAILPEKRFSDIVSKLVVPLCVGSIALGAVFEATVFRIAKFDEVDFCNQSLGAVLAAMGSLAALRSPKPRQPVFLFPLSIAAVFLGTGYYFAML